MYVRTIERIIKELNMNYIPFQSLQPELAFGVKAYRLNS